LWGNIVSIQILISSLASISVYVNFDARGLHLTGLLTQVRGISTTSVLLEGFQFCRLEVDFLSSIIPAEAGTIPGGSLSFTETNLDAGLRRHDENFPSPEGEGFQPSPKETLMIDWE
jgi:hypothetical protein